MGTEYGGKLISDKLYFCVDSSNPAFYKTNLVKDLRGNNNLTAQNCAFTASGFYFINPLSGTTTPTGFARSPINDTNFSMHTGRQISSFVTFYNTALLDSSVPGWYRQEPYAWGGDSTIGGWNFARAANSSSMYLTYKFDQEPTFGTNISFGDVNINQWTQLGFVINSSNLIIYKNAEIVGTVSLASKTITGALSTSATIAIGQMGYLSSNYYGFNGYIANAVFYQKALNEEEINYNYLILRRRLKF